MTQVAGKDYRDAMACLGAAVNIVTTDGNAGRAGFTASAICSVTDDPPTLLVCMNRGSSAYASVTGKRRALRERTIGPARAALAAVRWRDSGRRAVCVEPNATASHLDSTLFGLGAMSGLSQ
jgi:hypothetical protein